VSSSKIGRPNPRAGAPRLSRKPFVIVGTYIDESGNNDAQHIILGGSPCHARVERCVQPLSGELCRRGLSNEDPFSEADAQLAQERSACATQAAHSRKTQSSSLDISRRPLATQHE
jgi:hypothetical protein